MKVSGYGGTGFLAKELVQDGLRVGSLRISRFGFSVTLLSTLRYIHVQNIMCMYTSIHIYIYTPVTKTETDTHQIGTHEM